MEQNIKNKLIIIVISILIVVSIMLCFSTFYLIKQGQVLVIPEYNFFVKGLENTGTIASIAQEWTKKYMSQYTQKYLKLNMKIKDINITNVQVLDEENKIVRVDFSANKILKNSKFFFNNNISRSENEDGSIVCNFILEFAVVNNYEYGEIYYIKRRINPAQYDIEQYKISGQEQKDDKYYTFKNEKDYKDKFRQCTYKIENGEIYVTYDYSKSFKKVNINFDSVIDKDTYELKKGFYQISDELTIICVARGNEQIIAYSTNKGNSFSQINVDKNKFGNIMYIHFINKDVGFAVTSVDYAMGTAFIQVIRTNDAGKNWNTIMSDTQKMSLRGNSEFYFMDQNIGFIMEPNVDGTSSTLYRSEDGFKTFKEVLIPSQILSDNLNNDTLKWNIVYDTPKLPYLDRNNLMLVVEQGSDGDYKGGKTKAVYKSVDKGKTWIFIEEFEQANMPWEG